MNDIRKDFLLDRYAIISEKRGTRPKHFEALAREKAGQTCFFCPGNESLTPPTIDKYPKTGPWKIRVFNNKFPALKGVNGEHEVVVETENHDKGLQDLSPEELLQFFLMLERRRMALEHIFKHVAIFKNAGKEGGASLPHSHTQILASNFITPISGQEQAAAKLHYQKWHRCAWCDEMKKMDKQRIVLETEYAVAFTSNAPRFSYETWVLPKRHAGNFSDMTTVEMLDFCTVFKEVLTKLTVVLGSAPYNIAFHHAPKGNSKFYHFHLEIMPRVATHAGYELGEGAFIVDVSPETAAKNLRTA